MDFRTLDLLLKCGKEFRHNKIRKSGLTETECLICSYVYSHANCTQDDVAHALRIDKTTIAKAMRMLEEKGELLRARDPLDRRRKNLRLTDEGAEKVSAILNLHDQWLNDVLSCLPPDEREQFEKSCRRLLCAAEEMLSH